MMSSLPFSEVPTRTVSLHRVSFSALTEREVVDAILAAWSTGRGGWVSTPNTQQLRLVNQFPELHALVSSAPIVVADGMPLVWAAALQGDRLPERVAGSSLVWSLAEAAQDAGASLFLLGGEEGVARRAAARLEYVFPNVRIAGTYAPPEGFEHDVAEVARLETALTAAQPDIVYVGLGFPKQERLIVSLGDLFPGTWFLGIGASLSFISNDRVRAPRWMQRVGLEWLHRLVLEPTRLFRRYVVEGIPFTMRLLLASLAVRLTRSLG